jgi:hypothetical protein
LQKNTTSVIGGAISGALIEGTHKHPVAVIKPVESINFNGKRIPNGFGIHR